MDDALLNCMTGVCCPPQAQAAALAGALVADGVCRERGEADAVAHWLLKHFDLAEAGTLGPLKKSIARLAKS
jgi:hypothetical protein